MRTIAILALCLGATVASTAAAQAQPCPGAPCNRQPTPIFKYTIPLSPYDPRCASTTVGPNGMVCTAEKGMHDPNDCDPMLARNTYRYGPLCLAWPEDRAKWDSLGPQ